ncbi:hypothetical protein QYF36_009042 [Acer negundo]|nr:hypothetical protein QYF36_009042 [Acer negundo]
MSYLPFSVLTLALVMTSGICNGLSGMNSLVKKLDTLFLLNVNSSYKLIRDGSDEDAETIAALLNEFSSMANEEY